MATTADGDWAAVLLCIFQDGRDILIVLYECDSLGTALCTSGPTGYSLRVTGMIRSDPIASEGLGWTRHIHKVCREEGGPGNNKRS